MQFVDETTADLEALVARDFGSRPKHADFMQTVIDWLHYRARTIPQRPRVVLVSPLVLEKQVRYPAIGRIREALKRGDDVSPWLSERVRKRKADPTADLMFNDWQISHFHLGNVFERRDKVRRTTTGDLLFGHIKPDRAVLLDVQPHGRWSMIHLLKVLLELSSEDMLEMKGVLGTQSGPLNDQQYLNARKNGINAAIEIDGKVFMSPGFGIVGTQRATRLVLYASDLFRAIKEIRQQVQTNTLPTHLMAPLANTIGLPVRLGVRLDAGRLILYEKTRGIDLRVFQPLA